MKLFDTRVLFSGLLAMLVAVGAQAGVKEKKVMLPDGLGSGVLYLSDKKAAKGPAVVVVHEWWGLNDYARQRAKMLAEAGYSAIAVDMYGTGKVADHPKDATAFMNAALAEPEKMNARFDAAMAILKDQKGVQVDQLYAIGYCFGGAVVLNQARRGVDLAGVASFHGSLATENPAKAGEVKAEVLVATGGADPMVPAEQVAAVTGEMAAAGVKLTVLNFPQAKHSFTNPGATAVGEKYGMPLAYDEGADKESWAALMNMLAK
ncbi:dienelactone hydrolase family protein [Spongiibacter taiwanensis]|uniref:dienelactone hydrolase family protein n=1 Tax=Spongiibacter taiwanensis TaxID=1748242 RepID=UPI00203547F1|nr:dienelactone hydrolase family protein [Spongiibacter taiwanensis]USA42058.1 dienelactone hydrolase family protein [Spongiibacter taiwanensis]